MSGGALAVGKPSFTFDQIVKSTEAAKKFGRLREMAKAQPIVIIICKIQDARNPVRIGMKLH